MVVVNMNGILIDFESALNYMDEEILAELEAEYGPVTEGLYIHCGDLFANYEVRHMAKYGELWDLSRADNVWCLAY